nr:zinc finger, CCHC-type [Tanacetum cinerariifolium]
MFSSAIYTVMQVTSPYGNILHHLENITHGQFAFTSSESGQYLTCFSTDHPGQGGALSVNIDWKIGVAAKDWESVARKEKIEGVELELRKLEGAVEAIHENLLYLKNREAEMRGVSETTNARVAWYSILSLGICIMASGAQLCFDLKRKGHVYVGSLAQIWVQFIPDNGVGVSNSRLKDIHQSDGFSKKMHFLLSSMSVVYVLTTLMPEDEGDNPTVEQVRKSAKWDNDDYVCRGLILNGMSNSLFDIYQNVKTFKELWNTLEAKYMAEDASSKKFIISNFTNYKMTDSRPVLEQYNKLLGILGRFTQHKMNMDESIQVEKLPPLWKDFKHTLKHLKEELTLVELGSHLRIEESFTAQDNDKPKENNVAGHSVINMVKQNNFSGYNDNKAFMSTSKLNNSILWHARLGHVHFKRMQDMSKNGLIPAFDMDTKECNTCMLTKINKKPFQIVECETGVLKLIHSDTCNLHATLLLGNKKYFVTFIDDASRAVVRLSDLNLKTLGERGIKYIFVGYVEHSKAFRFFVIELNESVAINSIIKSRDAIFDENKFSSVPRLSQRSLVNRNEDSGGSVVLEKVTDEDEAFDKSKVLKNEVELQQGSMIKRFRTDKGGKRGIKYIFVGYVEHSKAFRTRDKVSDQHSYCFNVEDDPKTFDEAMKSQDVAFWKEAINDEIDSIMGNNTQVLADLPMGCKCIFKRKLKMETTFLNGELDEEVYMNQPQGFIMPGAENKKKFNYFDCTPVSTHTDTSEKLMPNNGQVVSQLEYSRVTGCLMYAMTSTRPDIAFDVGKLSRNCTNLGRIARNLVQLWVQFIPDNGVGGFLYAFLVAFWCILVRFMEKGDGEEDINSILNHFTSKMSHIMNIVGWEDHGIHEMKTVDVDVNTLNSSQPKSFATIVNAEQNTPKVHFRTLFNADRVDDTDFVLPVENVERAHNKFVNSLPTRCMDCLVFGHDSNGCPKRVVEPVTEKNDAQTDGFTTVHNRKNKGKQVDAGQLRTIDGASRSEDKDKDKKDYSDQDADKVINVTQTDDTNNGENDIADENDDVEKVIILGWNPDVVNIVVISFDDQEYVEELEVMNVNNGLLGIKILAGQMAEEMIGEVSDAEIRDAIFFKGDDKALAHIVLAKKEADTHQLHMFAETTTNSLFASVGAKKSIVGGVIATNFRAVRVEC